MAIIANPDVFAAQHWFAPQLLGPQMTATEYAVQQMIGSQLLAPQTLAASMQMHVPLVGVDWQAASTAAFAQQAVQASVYDPTASFMQQLGIDPTEEYLSWIAELGLQSPLPPSWELGTDPGTGCTFYVDQDRQTSTWENPLVPHLQRIVELGREYLQNPQEHFFLDARNRLWQERRTELEAWHGPFGDNSGQHYYVNSATGTTSPRDPRDEAQYIFEVQCNFLVNLEDVLARASQPDTPGRHWRAEGGCDGGDGGGGGPGERLSHPNGGAEVLTLDDGQESRLHAAAAGGGAASRTLRRLAVLRQSAKVDHTSTLQQMRRHAEHFREACLDDEEAQRMRLGKLVEARRRRQRLRQQPPGSLSGVALGTAPVAAAPLLRTDGIDAASGGAAPAEQVPPHRPS